MRTDWGRSLSSWRAALRFAFRDMLRHPLRSLLVALMVLTPAAGLSAGAVLWQTSYQDAQERVDVLLGPNMTFRVNGKLDGSVQQPYDGLRYVPSVIPEGHTQDQIAAWGRELTSQLRLWVEPGVQLAARANLKVPVSFVSGNQRFEATVREVEMGEITEDLFELRQGAWARLAQQPHEVVITQALADSTGLKLGDDIASSAQELAHIATDATPNADEPKVRAPVAGTARLAPEDEGLVSSWRVVGIVEDHLNPDLHAVLAPFGGIIGPTVTDDNPVQVAWSGRSRLPVNWSVVTALNDRGYAVVSRAVVMDPPQDAPRAADGRVSQLWLDNERRVATGLAIALAILQVVFLTGPAFTVGAKRNQRVLGIVLANGGTQGDAVRVVVSMGVVIGALATAGGVGLGLLVAMGAHRWAPEIPALAHPLDIRSLDLGAIFMAGFVTTVISAVLPAMRASQVPVTVSLQVRAPATDPKPRYFLAGAALSFVAVVLILGRFVMIPAIPLLAGSILLEIGIFIMLGSVLWVLSVVLRVGRWPLRLAVQDAMRHRTRTVPAIAAVMAAISIAAGLFTATWLSDRQAEVEFRSPVPMDTALILWEPRPNEAEAGFEAVANFLGVRSTDDAERVPLLGPDLRLFRLQVLKLPANHLVRPRDAQGLPLPCRPDAAQEAGPDGSPCWAGSWQFLGEQVLVSDDVMEVLRSAPKELYPSAFSEPAQVLGGMRILDTRTEFVDLETVGTAIDGARLDAKFSATEKQRLNAAVWVPGAARRLADGEEPMDGPTLEPEPLPAFAEDQRRRREALILLGLASDESMVVSQAAAQAWGGQAVTTGVLVSGLSAADREAIQGVTEEIRALPQVEIQSIEWGQRYAPAPRTLEMILVALALAVALVGALSTVALTRVENLRDHQLLNAVGTTPRQIRRMHAVHSLIVTVPGVVLGAALGGWMGSLWHVRHGGTALDIDQFALPWLALVTLTVGVPLSVAVIASSAGRVSATLRGSARMRKLRGWARSGDQRTTKRSG